MKSKRKVVHDQDEAVVRLNYMAQKALRASANNFATAIDFLDEYLQTENSAALERALCRVYRVTALRAILATQFHELSEQKRNLAEPSENVIAFEGRGYKTPYQINADAQRDLQRRWLDEYRINGQALGHCTVDEASGWASSRERDARFIRRLIEGLPGQAIIGEFRTHEDAEKCWVWAEQQD